MDMSFSMSANDYSDLTVGLALKNYPKMTFILPKSVHWIKSYGHVFSMSADVYSDLWIGLEKLPQNDSSIVKICPLDQKIE